MQNYKAPIDDINFLLNGVFDYESLAEELQNSDDYPADLVEAIINEAGKFAEGVLSPINQSGDIEGCVAKDGKVTTPKGFKDAYEAFVASGWNSVSLPKEYGGQGLPMLVSTAISEMWSSSNMAFALCPLLTQGAVHSLDAHGSEEQKQTYLENLISGKWTGTMCLTEPNAGSDVGGVATKATKDGDRYRIKGQKIYITYGEHDLSENIIHMVLARTENAPKGSKGISLFIAPKILKDGTRNDVKAISIEHKMGINASPTAVLAFGDNEGAEAYLVGEENAGLKYMFTMMNSARLAVGVEGVAIAENSLQQASEYAKERQQFGQAIASFPDVQRMLMTIRANTESMRALSYYVAKSLDLANSHSNLSTRQKHQNIVDLLIPVLKSYATDIGFAMSSEAMQIFAGIGYIEETGIAQNVRDARIAMIYEGTNGIQAMDLVARKITINNGELFGSLADDIANFYKGSEHEQTAGEAFVMLSDATSTMQNMVKEAPQRAGFVAAYYLKMFAIVMGAAMMSASEKQATLMLRTDNANKNFCHRKIATSCFYMDYILPEAECLHKIISN